MFLRKNMSVIPRIPSISPSEISYPPLTPVISSLTPVNSVPQFYDYTPSTVRVENTSFSFPMPVSQQRITNKIPIQDPGKITIIDVPMKNEVVFDNNDKSEDKLISEFFPSRDEQKTKPII